MRARLSARPTWSTGTELRKRLRLDTRVAENGAVCAAFPYHYYRFDRDLVDAAIEWVLAFGEALDEELATEPSVTPTAGRTAIALSPYRGVAPVVPASSPPPSYLKQVRRLVLAHRLKRSWPLLLLTLHMA